MEEGKDWEEWLSSKLEEMELDKGVYVPFVKGYLEQEMAEESEVKESINSLISATIVVYRTAFFFFSFHFLT